MAAVGRAGGSVTVACRRTFPRGVRVARSARGFAIGSTGATSRLCPAGRASRPACACSFSSSIRPLPALGVRSRSRQPARSRSNKRVIVSTAEAPDPPVSAQSLAGSVLEGFVSSARAAAHVGAARSVACRAPRVFRFRVPINRRGANQKWYQFRQHPHGSVERWSREKLATRG